MNRRTFHKTSAAAIGLAAARQAAAAADRIVGANQRLRLGFIGVANRGRQLLDGFMVHQDSEIVALCDVNSATLARAREKVGGSADGYEDFRRLIDRQDIDAVVIATPDHWHALQTVAACDAGKDVYVEKPLSITIHEGRRMVEAARRNERVVQVGTHRRSSELYTDLARRARAGDFGKICVSQAYRLSNMYPSGIGRAQPKDPPRELNWDLWLGPRLPAEHRAL